MSNIGYKPSIVEYHNDINDGHSCGYCHSKDTSYSDGMWAHTMTVEDYQDLIDRGWRRSGHFCYKPIMTATCCPMYTIRCTAEDFKISKSQKKILKRFHKFLAYGTEDKNVKPSVLNKTEVMHSLYVPDKEFDLPSKNLDIHAESLNKLETSNTTSNKESSPQHTEKKEKSHENISSRVNIPQSGGKHQMKAKYLRIERKKEKLRKMGLTEKEIMEKMLEKKKKCSTVKTLEDFLNQPLPPNPAHKLEIRLVRPFPDAPGIDETIEVYNRYQMTVHNDPPEKLSRGRFQRFFAFSPLEIRLVLVKSSEFEKTFTESTSLFAKYQKTVHNESDEECSSLVFNYFLVDSPLEPKIFYGSYHQQYWLDEKLIAVGVIDILPKCLSSVYFFYDPDYMWLSLGTYGALREVEYVRKLTSQYPDIKYYYMGFYIHSCVKMRYKAAFRPSYLLCPEVYTWHPIQSCLPKLDFAKYSRLNEDLSIKDNNSAVVLSDVSVLFNRTVMSFASYTKLKKCSAEEHDEIMKYAMLVGMVCAKRILLYRN